MRFKQFSLLILFTLLLSGGIIVASKHSIAAETLSIAVLNDPNRLENFQTIITKINSGSLKSKPISNGIDLGVSGDPTWIIFDITGHDKQKPITLSLGTSDDGRLGFLSSFILYNRTTGQTISNHGKDSTQEFLSSDFVIPPHNSQTIQLIAFVEPVKGSYVVIKPTLNPSYMISLLGSNSLNGFLFLMAFGLYLISALGRHIHGAIGLAIISFGLYLHRSWLDDFIILPHSLGIYTTPLLWIITGLILFISLCQLLRTKIDFPVAIMAGGSFLILIVNIVGLALIGSQSSLSLLLIYTPIFLVSAIGAIYYLKYSIKSLNLSLIGNAVISMLVSVIILSVFLNSFNILSTQTIIQVLSGTILSLGFIISGLLYLITTLNQSNAMATNTSSPSTEDSDENWMTAARDTSEQKRLLQVLQQERSTMVKLQEAESQRVEEMRKSKEAADEANRAKSAFLAIVSHEIRTPMTGIMGMVRLLHDTQLSKDQREFTDTIQDSGEALLSLLNDILDFEKIENGKMDFEKVDFDFHRLIKGIQTLMSGHATAKQLQLILDMDQTIPEMMIGDPTRIRQVILNLVNNAIKFTSKGSITIQVRDLSPNKTDNSVQIYVGVQDQGIGISPEAQRKIFMPFAQADSSTSRKYGGTGLGLAICKNLIEQMGGQIGINSRENEGSTFFFTLTLLKSTGSNSLSPSVIIPKPQTTTMKPIRILVVDDNGINQKVLNGLLAKYNHKVFLASDGVEAMNILNNEDLDLVLMDVQLPGKNGLEVTADIRALSNPLKSSIPIVAMTGNTQDEDVKACLAAGMNDFLGKPISPELLHSITIKTIAGQYETVAQALNDIEPIDPESHDDEFDRIVRELEEREDSTSIPDFDFKSNGLNEDIILSLYKSLGKEQTKELLISFYETTDSIMEQLDSLKQSTNFDDIYARAHELKGMAANFGFERLSHIASDIEMASQQKNPSAVETGTDQLRYAYETSRHAMDKFLS